MFPIPWNFPFRKKNGDVTTIGEMVDSGGGGGSYTPDYENDRLIIGVHDDFNYYVPMSKEYVGEGIAGYEIKTDPQSSSSTAMINIYSLIYLDGEIMYKTFIKRLIHNADKDYEDDNISVTYTGSQWRVTSLVPLYNESGVVYESPLAWSYNTVVDYIMLVENPV